jgi:hypothetical protein
MGPKARRVSGATLCLAAAVLAVAGWNEARSGAVSTDDAQLRGDLTSLAPSFRPEIDGHVDTVAERIVQLGVTAVATLLAVAARSRLPAYSTSITGAHAYLDALLQRCAATASFVRSGIDQCNTVGDASSADILTAFSPVLDRAVWFIEAHGIWRLSRSRGCGSGH